MTDPHHRSLDEAQALVDRALFMVGSALFALGSAPFYPELVPSDTGEL